MEKYRENSRSLNGILVATLLDLNAVEAASMMEQAFAAKAVELAVAGDWEDVQIELGLKDERETPKPNYIAEALFSGRRRHHKRKKK